MSSPSTVALAEGEGLNLNRHLNLFLFTFPLTLTFTFLPYLPINQPPVPEALPEVPAPAVAAEKLVLRAERSEGIVELARPSASPHGHRESRA